MWRRFKRLKTNDHIQLWFNAKTTQVWFLNQWWDVDFLKRNFSIAEDPIVEPLGELKSPGFAAGVKSREPFSNRTSYRGAHTRRTMDF